MNNSLDDKQRILFAELYRLTNYIKDETKALTKTNELILTGMEWDTLTNAANSIIDTAREIQKRAVQIQSQAAGFIVNGPYPGQTPGKTPLESAADTEEAGA